MLNGTDTLRHGSLDLDIQRHYFWHVYPYRQTTRIGTRASSLLPASCPPDHGPDANERALKRKLTGAAPHVEGTRR